MRAELRCGELLKVTAKAKPSGSNQHMKKEEVSLSTTPPKRLDEMGISRDQSSQWQRLAEVPRATRRCGELLDGAAGAGRTD